MADWKSALAALGATEDDNKNETKTDIERKKRVGVFTLQILTLNTQTVVRNRIDDYICDLLLSKLKV